MALSENGGGMYMPVAPVYGGGFGGGNGGFGDNGWWIILLFLVFGGAWGRGGFGGGGGMGGGGDLYPWINNSEHISDGFRDQMLQTSVYGIGDRITTGFGDVQNALCNGFAGVNAAITNAQMNSIQQIYGVQSALQNCCCENRAGLADVKYTIATEACATRSANSANTQAILDKLCQLELDGYKREADALRQQLSDAKFAASQAAQNTFIQKGFSDEVDALYNRLSNCPVPSTPVYGRTPIFTCNNNGCGCGCGG